MTLLFLLSQERRIRGLEVKKLTGNRYLITTKRFCGKLKNIIRRTFKKKSDLTKHFIKAVFPTIHII